MTVFPDVTTPFGERVERRLRDEMVIWLTTVRADGTPQPNPVWFLRDGDTLLIYCQPTAFKLRHLASNPRVSLNLSCDDDGDNVIVLTGAARVASGHPLASGVPAYMAKYGEAAKRIKVDMDEYSVAIRVNVEKVRGY